jgi:hypothetical protein
MSSRRFSLVLSEFAHSRSEQRIKPTGPFCQVVLPAFATATREQRGGTMTRRGLSTAHDPEVGAAGEHGSAGSTTPHHHHVVALDVPALPKRAGLRNCLVCMGCMWIWVATIIFLTVASWRPEFAAAIQVTRRLGWHREVVAVPPRMASERNHCSFSVLASSGRPTRLQLQLTLSDTLDVSVDEEDIAVTQLSPGFFEVDVACCTRELHQVLTSSTCIELWNKRLGQQYSSTVIVSRHVELEQPPLSGNTSLPLQRLG